MQDKTANEIAAVIEDIYRETRGFYATVQPQLGTRFDHGFRILYGPPVRRPTALVVGFQPGGDLSHARPEEHLGPSPKNEYLNRHWPLARELRRRFSTEWLESVVGLNAIFVRCPSTSLWNQLDTSLRMRIEDFCRARTLRVIDLLAPEKVVLLGWDTLEVMRAGPFSEMVAHKRVAERRRRRRLAQTGRLAGVAAVAIAHPTAAWKAPPVTDEDWTEIERVVRA